ncbi:SRPBCC family protein [Paenirhodobacter sp.]|uniref:SRPBCC family protein n=1 Tax=Paenirhodobacter sp. TaxID=1965326 RepID=UPI003B3C5ABA
MKFTSRTDISAPAEAVFDRMADFSPFAAEAGRRGLRLRRTDGLTQPGPGMTWEVDFRFRGRMRHLDLRASRFVRPEQIEYHGESTGFEMVGTVQVVALSPARTRLHVGVELRPRSLGARILLQSARLGRVRIQHRFDERIALFATMVEEQLLGV